MPMFLVREPCRGAKDLRLWLWFGSNQTSTRPADQGAMSVLSWDDCGSLQPFFLGVSGILDLVLDDPDQAALNRKNDKDHIWGKAMLSPRFSLESIHWQPLLDAPFPHEPWCKVLGRSPDFQRFVLQAMHEDFIDP